VLPAKEALINVRIYRFAGQFAVSISDGCMGVLFPFDSYMSKSRAGEDLLSSLIIQDMKLDTSTILLKIPAIIFEYLKAEIVNISKAYLKNLPLKLKVAGAKIWLPHPNYAQLIIQVLNPSHGLCITHRSEIPLSR